MIDKTSHLRHKAAALRSSASTESDPGLSSALLTRARACETLATLIDDDQHCAWMLSPKPGLHVT